jgi:hemerythrin
MIKGILNNEDNYQFIKTQHEGIFKLIQKLRKAVSIHIKDEELLLDKRDKTKPDTHIDIKEKLKNHKKNHIEFIEKLLELETMFDHHIKLYDMIHIHRL